MAQPKREIRTLRDQPKIVRSADGKPKIVGYAARFNELSLDLGGFREKIRPGAFLAALDRDDVRALYNHDDGKVLGRASAGTLRLFEDDHGLRYEIDPPDAQWARDLIVSMDRGDIRESSFGFRLSKEEWDETIDPPVRTIIEVSRLYDVGPVTFPAYPTTSSDVRSAKEVYDEFRATSGTGPEGTQPSATWSQQLEQLERRLLTLA
ncbi:MAG: HK97 family phage prohead protease [Candidatus Eisenbacteria sp.]|nr:HK97 family phage prohead protease [Candidatus Eisenbacteria bacterium]